jgi:hypothetical protein
MVREERERERQQMQATIDDLRRRLDVEGEERRRLTLMLTHRPEQPPPEAPKTASASPAPPFWTMTTGPAYVVTLIVAVGCFWAWWVWGKPSL